MNNKKLKTPCQHFENCGGCTLQHLSHESYLEFKQGILSKIIENLGADRSVISPIIEVGPQSRRRAEFKVAVNKGNVQVGFFEPKTHNVVDLIECPVSDKQLVQILPKLKQQIKSLKKPGNIKAVSLTLLEDGLLDVIIITNSPMKSSDKEQVISFGRKNSIIRLSEQTEGNEAVCLYGDTDALINFANINVLLPLGGFLQATEAGQREITDLVTKHLQDCKKIADLYSGCGTYSFPLSKISKSVAAYEGSEDMVTAMHNAAIKHGLDSKVYTSTRDLFKNPLKETELQNFDGAVINPPRNGALPQVKKLAKSNIQKIAMVSCNPSTFQRDAQELLNNSYKLTMAVPIDQFLWSNHLEIVAFFEK